MDKVQQFEWYRKGLRKGLAGGEFAGPELNDQARQHYSLGYQAGRTHLSLLVGQAMKTYEVTDEDLKGAR